MDVREDIHNGREPFSKIMMTVAQLQNGQRLRLLAPFEPVPLFGVLARQGFSHEAQPMANGDWEVLFTRAEALPAANGVHLPEADREVVEVDARGLEPPGPLVMILEALETLPPDADLLARTDRRPLHLYPQLEARGFSGATQQHADGSFMTLIQRA
ncbi:MAG: DUF2249 domain-containing protein [Verrucomicrobiota bacterium]